MFYTVMNKRCAFSRPVHYEMARNHHMQYLNRCRPPRENSTLRNEAIVKMGKIEADVSGPGARPQGGVFQWEPTAPRWRLGFGFASALYPLPHGRASEMVGTAHPTS
jgi:hypothetical protein